jgi:hypothetical protein
MQEFQDFIKTTACPKSVKVACGRVKNHHLQKHIPCEPTSQMQTVNYDTFSKDLDPDTIDIVALAGTSGVHQTDNDELDCIIGLSHDWSQQSHQVRIVCKLFCKNYSVNIFCMFH